MNPEDPRTWLPHLEDVARAAREAGDARAEADALQRIAGLMTASQRLDEASERLQSAALLYRSLGDLGKQADCLLMQGRMLARLPGRHVEARAPLDEAASLYEATGALATKYGQSALREIAGTYATDQDWPAASTALNRLVDVLRGSGQPADLAQALRARAMFEQGAGQFDAALVSYDAAVDAATQAAAPLPLLQLRLERRVLRDVLNREAEPFSALLDEIETLGDPGLLNDVQLEQATAAVRAGRPRDALAHAQQARHAALQAGDPLRYLLACLVIAEVRDQNGDRPGVLAILLTAKNSLEQLLGPEAGQPIVMILDSLGQRWGKAELHTALQVYRAQMKQQAGQA